MIHLIAIQTSPGVWTITTSDMVEKHDRPNKLIQKMRESGKEWKEDQPHWSVIYDKEPE